MINADMRLYNYFTFGNNSGYGQPVLSEEPVGTIKIAIYTLSQSNTNNIKYNAATYIGLTTAEVNDTYVIEYGKERLKVLYVNNAGRFKQVYLGEL